MLNSRIGGGGGGGGEMVTKRNNQVLIISSVQVENFRYSIIPVKKELIITPQK